MTRVMDRGQRSGPDPDLGPRHRREWARPPVRYLSCRLLRRVGPTQTERADSGESEQKESCTKTLRTEPKTEREQIYRQKPSECNWLGKGSRWQATSEWKDIVQEQARTSLETTAKGTNKWMA
jgi:hypothetical protein